MKTNDTQNNAQHLERAPGSAAPRHQRPAHPCVCWWRRGAVSQQSESGEGRALEGTGTKEDPYKISSAAELEEFRDKVNNGETDASAVLTADIDLNPNMEISEDGTVTNGDDLDQWTPIGTSYANAYTGTFDGNGHTISGLYIDSNADYQGLFGYVGSSGKVQNLSVSGSVSVSGGEDVGGIVGYNSFGTVTNCAFSGSVSGSDHVGGVVGYNFIGGSVTNCYNTGAVSGGEDVGGVVGWNDSGIVKNCYNIGKVTGSADSSNVGGVVGQNSDSSSVTNCYNTGAVNSSGNRVGGVVGYNISIVTNCYNTGTVSSNSNISDVGGVVGYNHGGRVENCYNTGEVSGKISVGGVVGLNDSGIVENCYNTGEVSGTRNYAGGVVGSNSFGATVTNCYFLQQNGVPENGIGGGYTDWQTAEPVDNLDKLCGKFENDPWSIHPVLGRPVLNENKEGGLGTEASPYEISTADELKNFATAVNGGETTANAVLTDDINLNPNMEISEDGTVTNGSDLDQWTPIGNSESTAYTGTFDGQNFKISGLYIKNTSSDTDYQGLFGYVSGTVKDLSVSGSVSGNDFVGGVVGWNFGGTVTGCAFSGSVKGSGSDHVGGVVGRNYGSVQNSYNTGAVSGGEYVGGVVGWNISSGNVKNCYNTGSVSGPDSGTGNRVGGVVGYNSGNVTNYYNTGEVSGNSYVGGVVGYNVVTPLGGGTVENCYNTGNISGNISGGVVGWNDSGANVENCYNTGTVTGTDDYVGGVVGHNSGTVENCYNTGAVNSSGNYVGGVVGFNIGIGIGTVTGCYFLKTDDVNVGRPGIGDGSGDAAEKDDTAFHSGEVAWRLQAGQKAAGEEDPIPQVWGQNIGEDKLPVLTSDSEKTVYQVTINLNDSDSTENETRYTNSDLQALTPTREGYTFDGWYESADCSGEAVTTITDLTDNTATLYAKWTPNTYTVTLHTNDGTIAEGQNVTSYIYGVGAKLPTENEITKTGYIFAGWYNNADLTGDPVTEISKTDINDKAYWAKWEEVENPEPTPTPTPDPTPSGPSTGDSTGWDDIRDELENAAKGDEITIDMGDETKVPAEIFESLAGKDVEISFDLGDIQWSVNGADIPTDTDFTDLDLGVNLDTHGIPVNVINTITGEVGTVQITLAHDGEFGFTMTLTAPLGKENAGYWANFYHYDESAEAMNFEAAAKIDEDGSVTIPFSHASQYAIVIDTHSHATVDVSDIFLDIAPDAWYKDAVQYAYDNGLMTGVSATEFAPEATTTRAMIVSILARLENVTTAEAAGFNDVNDDWYATAVNWAANVGVVNGYEDNTFRPNTAITREQLAAILMNYAAYKGEDVSNRADLTSYTDQPSTWAEEAISWSVAEGLLTGVTADTLQPQGAATRAQVAAILQRFLSE